MGFFWPTWTADVPSGPTRFGRLVHWVGLIVGLPLAACGAFGMASDALGQPFTGAVVLIVALMIYFASRGLRYAISGE